MAFDPYAFLDPQVRSLLQGGSPRIPTGIPRNIAKMLGQSDEDELSPEEERSLLGTLGHTGMSGLQWLGETLDKPGAAVRGLLAGRPGELANLIPFSDTLGITDPSQRTSGRDLLEQWGALDPNQEGFDAGDVAGFATEILTDPLTFLTGAGALKAVSPAGRVAKRAGLLDDALKAASKAGKGPRSFLRNTTFGDVWSAADEVGRAKLGEAASKMKLDPANLMSEKLGDVLGATWKPMGHAKTTFGTQGIAEKADKLGEWLRYGNPVGLGFGRAFRPVASAKSAWGQKGAGQTIEETTADVLAAKQAQYNLLQGMPASQVGKETGEKLRRWEELNLQGPMLPDEQAALEMFQQQRARENASYAGLQEAGVNTANLKDLGAEHVYRAIFGLDPAGGMGSAGGKTYGTFSPAQGARVEPYKNIKGGTESLQEIISDPAIRAAIKSNAETKDIAKIVLDKYGDRLLVPEEAIQKGDPVQWTVGGVDQFLDNELPSLLDFSKDGKFAFVSGTNTGLPIEQLSSPAIAERTAAAIGAHAKSLATRMKEHVPWDWLETGIPYSDPRAGTFASDIANTKALARAKGATRMIGDVLEGTAPLPDGFTLADVTRTRASDPEKSVLLGEVLDKLNLTGEEALVNLRKRELGPEGFEKAMMEFAEAADEGGKADIGSWLKQVRDYRIPRELADEILHIEKNLTGPDAFGGLTKFTRGLNAISKALWLAKPSYHARNLTGGQIEAALQGHYSSFGTSRAARRDVGQLLRGKNIAALENEPAIQRMMDEAKLPHSNENANRVVRSYLAARSGAPMEHALDVGSDIADTGRLAPDVNDPALASLLGHIPGRTRETLGTALAKLKGPYLAPGEGSKLKRFSKQMASIRGVGERTTTANPIAAANEAVAAITEHQNRFAPWLDMIRNGWEPEAAMREIDKAQVNYSPGNYSKFERQVMSQAFPFWKYTSRKGADVLRQLAERPGGPHAQIIKESARLTSDEPGLPEHVTGQLAIPIPEGTPLIGPEAGGDPRFLTGLGLMHEQPLGLLGPNPLRQLMSQLTPLAKLPIELGTRELLFQPGADLGGRAMDDADPNIGRIIANLRDQVTGERTYKAQPFGGQATEAILANSPFAAWLTSIRAAADPRKSKLQKALNLATGVRTTDVNQASRDAVVREALQRLMKQGGAQEFTKVYFDPTTEARMTPQEFAEAQQMEQLAAILASRAKARKKQRLETTGK